MVAGLITAVLLALFVTGWIWIWLPRHKAALDEAARMPLEDEGNKTP